MFLLILVFLLSVMGSDFRFLFWICQGCGHQWFHKILNEYNKEFHLDVVALFETRISGSRAEAVIAKMGFDYSFRVDAVGFTGGIWFL